MLEKAIRAKYPSLSFSSRLQRQNSLSSTSPDLSQRTDESLALGKDGRARRILLVEENVLESLQSDQGQRAFLPLAQALPVVLVLSDSLHREDQYQLDHKLLPLSLKQL